jgi:hypothetical protein
VDFTGDMDLDGFFTNSHLGRVRNVGECIIKRVPRTHVDMVRPEFFAFLMSKAQSQQYKSRITDLNELRYTLMTFQRSLHMS